MMGDSDDDDKNNSEKQQALIKEKKRKKAEYNRRYREANKPKIAEQKQKDREKNQPKTAEKHRLSWEKDRPKIAQQYQQYNVKKAKQMTKENEKEEEKKKEKIAKQQQQYKHENGPKIKQQMQHYCKKNESKIKPQKQQYEHENKEKIAKKKKIQRQKINNETYKDFETKETINEALELYYINSGADRFVAADRLAEEVTVDRAVVRDLSSEITKESLTHEEISKMFERFQTRASRVTALLSCAACGVRDFSSPVHGEYKKVLITDLNSCIRLTKEENEKLAAIMSEPSVTIYVDANLTEKTVHLSKARSFYVHLNDNSDEEAFHLHPELVDENSCYLCPDCFEKIQVKNERPQYSIANGVDFGYFERLGLTEPNLFERMILSRIRLFQTRLKIQSTRLRSQLEQSCLPEQERLRGFVLLFEHDAPYLVQDLLTGFNGITDYIRLFCVGPKGETDRYLELFLGTSILSGRPYVIHQWATILSKLNRHFPDNFHVPTISELQTMVDKASTELLTTARHITDEESLQREAVIGNDIANVRNFSQATTEPTTTEANSCDVPLQYSFVSDPTGNDSDLEKEVCNKIVNVIEKVHNKPNLVLHSDGDSNATEQNSEPNTAATETTAHLSPDDENTSLRKSFRAPQPIDEFQHNDLALTGSFPTIFLFGIAYERKGTLTEGMTRHLLLQFTNMPAQCRELIFLLFDQKQRHEVIHNMHAQLSGRQNKESFQRLCKLLATPKFQDLLARAKHDPTSKAFGTVIQTVMPIIQVAGKSVPFGSMERNFGLTKHLAVARHCGPSSVFLTVGINETSSPNVMRCCFQTKSNVEFPAVATSNFLLALKTDGEFTVPGFDLPIPLGFQHRVELATKNPVAVTQEYLHLVNCILEVLIGMSSEKNIKKTSMYKLRSKGIFGQANAFYGVTEAYGRGTLHFHVTVYGGLSPELLQKVAHRSDVRAVVGLALDSMFQANLPRKVHVLKFIQNNMGWKVDVPSKSDCPSPTSMPWVEWIQAMPRRQHECAMYTNIHKHQFTCAKPPQGRYHCRMCYPQNIVPCTRPVELSVDGVNGDGSNIIHAEAVHLSPPMLPPPDPGEYAQFFLTPDKRVIVWEVKRPLLENLFLATTENEQITAIQEALEEYLSPEISHWLQTLGEEKLLILYNDLNDQLTSGNGWIVTFNSHLTCLLGCNTAAYPLGTTQQSNNTMFYLHPYLGKNKAELADCVNLLCDMYQEIIVTEKRQSTAKDKDTIPRKTAFLFTRLLNRLDKLMEISDCQAVASLLGQGADISSEKFAFCGPLEHYNFIRLNETRNPTGNNQNTSEAFNCSHESIAEYAEDDNSECTAFSLESFLVESSDEEVPIENQEDDDSQFQEEHVTDVTGNDSMDKEDEFVPGHIPYTEASTKNIGPAKLYSIDGGKATHVAYFPELYRNRGEKLKDLNREEYFALLEVAKKPPTDKTRSRGRKLNTTFEFDANFPLCHEYSQRIRSKQCVVIQKGRMPKFPGVRPIDASMLPKWKKEADSFAAYILTLYRPEAAHFKEIQADRERNKYHYNWEALVEFLSELRTKAHGGNDLEHRLARYRLRALQNSVLAFRSNSYSRTLMSEYRGKSRTVWSEQESNKYKSVYAKVDFHKSRYASNQQNPTFDDEKESWQHLDAQTGFRAFPNDVAQRKAVATLNFVACEKRMLDLVFSKATENVCETHPQESMTRQPVIKRLDDPIVLQISPYQIEMFWETCVKTNDDPNVDVPDAGNTTIHARSSNESRSSEGVDIDTLTCDQREIFLLIRTFIANDLPPMSTRCDKLSTAGVPQGLFLVTGGPGTGKTHLAQCIGTELRSLGKGDDLRSSEYASAAVNFGGVTNASLYHFTGRQKETDTPTFKDLNHSQTNELRQRLRGKSIIMIDECGTLTADILGMISQRLQTVFKDMRPFGGITVILFGDFNQLQPIGLGLPSAALLIAKFDSQHQNSARLALASNKKDKYALNAFVREGVNVFTKFKWRYLTQQVRSAKDPVHQELINKMYRGEELNPDADFQHLKLLTQDDVVQNPEFLHAPILVPSNLERMEIIELKARVFAKLNDTCVVRWQNTIKDDWVGNKPTDVEETINQSVCCWEYFVAGGKGHILHNFNQSKNIVNGADVIYHSITLSDGAESNRLKDAICSALPGQVITLSTPPVSVNVRLQGNIKQLHSLVRTEKNRKDKKNHSVIIPICHENIAYTRYKSFTIETSRHAPCIIQVRRYFEVELAFALTVHKAQGKTIEKVIISLDERPAGLASFTYAHLLVALSRVQMGADIRILTTAPTLSEALSYIKNLKPNRDIKAYFDGYSKDPDNWSYQLALESWSSQTSPVRTKSRFSYKSATKR